MQQHNGVCFPVSIQEYSLWRNWVTDEVLSVCLFMGLGLVPLSQLLGLEEM